MTVPQSLCPVAGNMAIRLRLATISITSEHKRKLQHTKMYILVEVNLRSLNPYTASELFVLPELVYKRVMKIFDVENEAIQACHQYINNNKNSDLFYYVSDTRPLNDSHRHFSIITEFSRPHTPLEETEPSSCLNPSRTFHRPQIVIPSTTRSPYLPGIKGAVLSPGSPISWKSL